MYTCHTPFGIHRTTTISKSIRSGDTNNQSPNIANTHQANFIYLVQIDWKTIQSPKMRFGSGRFSGREIEAKEYIKKESLGLYGRPCTFTGEDGRDYKWCITNLQIKLILNDGSETPIALYHVQTLLKKPYFEIFPAGQHMVDEIFITFIYTERLQGLQ
ncbi:hypothetical protein GYMLUDRAFT_412702 [Collybiopsis luxurians FD-317 M1]|nr:hypothetical protein GYMLUDRAFT_412702 [Collybiopsis luxurians FD-317 M1]